MKISVILAHPNEGSFNHAIAARVVETLKEKGDEVRFHDLYKERFDPLLPAEEFERTADLPPKIQAHCEEISEADGIVVVHPNWWGQPPAILKGWIDRVLRPGVAYEFLERDQGEGIPNGLLKARRAIVFNTSNTGAQREIDTFGDPLEAIWKQCIFDLCGIIDVYRKTFGIIVVSSERQRKAWLEEVRNSVSEYFREG